MADGAQRVTVVTICREPPEVVRRFAAWHRQLGADEVRILFDDPHDPCIAALAGLDWLRAVPCDGAFWAGLGLRPEDPFQVRQVAALTHAYRSVAAGWVAVLDADEAFHFGGRRFAEVLAAVPDAVRAVRVRTAEYLETGPDVTDGRLHFRTPMTKPEASEVYREAGVFFRPSRGLIGHNEGKSITRAGLKIRRMRPHWAAAGAERDLTGLHLGPDAQACLLHFINRGYGPWRAKLDRRLAVPGGISQRIRHAVARIRAEGGGEGEAVEAGLCALYGQLHAADAALIARLQAAGRHLALEDGFGAAVAAVFGEAGSSTGPQDRGGVMQGGAWKAAEGAI